MICLLLPIFDWPIIIIAPGGLLLVIFRNLPLICSSIFTFVGPVGRTPHTLVPWASNRKITIFNWTLMPNPNENLDTLIGYQVTFFWLSMGE